MTEAQCNSCAKPSPHCQDKEVAHLIHCECWNYTPVVEGQKPWKQLVAEGHPFEQFMIERHDTDQIETLLHIHGCGCPACMRMGRRGYVKVMNHKWISSEFARNKRG